MRARAVIPVLVLTLLLSACAGRALSWDPARYEVREGDTLYSIAFRFGMDYRELAQLNDIDPPYVIYPGQRLALKAGSRASRGSSAPRESRSGSGTSSAGSSGSSERGESASPRASSSHVSWRWPTDGRVLRGFGDSGQTGKGVDIGGQDGQPVRAAGGGRVVYSGSGLIGYGQLIIIKHDDTFISAYAHNRRIDVDEGDAVTAGDVIGEMGRGPDDTPLLHFEIRVDGKAVDPLLYLPER